LVFTLGSLVLVPVTLMILVTGGALGALAGIPAALCGVVAAAVATFLLGRTLGREAVRRIAGRPANGLARKLARHGVLTVALIRLVPIAPFTVVNLVAGVSELRLTQFTLGTLLGMAPGIVVMIALGDRMAAFLREPGPLGLVILVLVIAVGVAAALLARRLLRRHAAE
jgi:phospholipase D1/2